MSQTPGHDWMRPRLEALLAQAEQAGITREVAVAVLTDLIEALNGAGQPPAPNLAAD
jgi:hypothetical protein